MTVARTTTLNQISHRKGCAVKQRKWNPCGQYAMESHSFTVCKCLVMGDWFYVLSEGRGVQAVRLGQFKSFDEAANFLEKMK